MSEARVYERSLTREELFASGSLRMEGQGYYEQMPPSQTLEPPYGQLDGRFEQPRPYAAAERPFMDELQPPQYYMEQQRTLPPPGPGHPASPSWEQEQYYGAPPGAEQYYDAPPPMMGPPGGPQYPAPTRSGLLDHSFGGPPPPQQGPLMTMQEGYYAPPDADDPRAPMEEASEFYGPLTALSDWLVNPLADRVADSVKIIFEGVSALNDASKPVLRGIQQVAHEAAVDFKSATDFVGVTMDYVNCNSCGAVIPAGELYCLKCGAPRPGFNPGMLQDDGYTSTSSQPADMQPGPPLRSFAGGEVPEAYPSSVGYGLGAPYPPTSSFVEGPDMRSQMRSPMPSQTSMPVAMAPQSLEPQYPTYSGAVAGSGQLSMPRSGGFGASVKYARVMSEAEAAGSLRATPQASTTFRSSPALSAAVAGTSGGGIPYAVNASMPQLAPGRVLTA